MCECVIFLLFLTCRGNQSSFWNSGAGVELIVFILSYHTLPIWARHASLYLFGYPIISINTHGPSPSKAALLKCIFVTVGALTNYVFFVWMYFNLHKWHRMAHLIIFLISPSNTMHWNPSPSTVCWLSLLLLTISSFCGGHSQLSQELTQIVSTSPPPKNIMPWVSSR